MAVADGCCPGGKHNPASVEPILKEKARFFGTNRQNPRFCHLGGVKFEAPKYPKYIGCYCARKHAVASRSCIQIHLE